MIYLFHGKNTYLISQKVNYWKKKFTEKHGDMNISTINGNAGTNAYDIITECDTAPFLSEKRLIIVKNFFQSAKPEQQKILAEKIAKGISDSTILVLFEDQLLDKRTSVYKKLVKTCTLEEFNTLENYDLIEWIMTKAKEKGHILNHDLARYLAEIAGDNLWYLENEIVKLALYRQKGNITKQDIDLLTAPASHDIIFKLTDLIGQKRAGEAIDMLEKMTKKGEDIKFIYHMIVRQFRIIIQIANLFEKNKPLPEIIKLLKLHPFVVSNTAKQAKNFQMSGLKKIYQRLLDIDIADKTGKIKTTTSNTKEFLLEVEKFIVESSN